MSVMDQVSVSVSSFVSHLEDMRLPYIATSSYVKTVIAAIPLAVLAHDLSDYWLPSKVYVPIVSWFTRRWRADPDAKHAHLRAIRNLLIFALFVILQNESEQADVSQGQPSEFVDRRLASPTATRTLSNEIYKSRRAAFAAADEVIGEEESDMAASQQQMDATLRRRHLHDTRAKK